MIFNLYPGVVFALIGGGLIALASTLNFLVTGRITGMSSIFYSFVTRDKDVMWKSVFVFGMLTPVYAMYLNSKNGAIAGSEFFWPNYYDIWAFAIGGMLVGIGTKVGNGCTSGHAVCGIARLSKRSIVATMLFVSFGLATGTLVDRLGWRRPGESHAEWVADYVGKVFPAASYVLAGIMAAFALYMFVKGVLARKSADDVIELVLSYLVGVLFGAGLAISGMCNPRKILGFLTLGDDWDPTLIFVMASAIGINLITFQLILHLRESPVLLPKFASPKKEFDVPVIVGPIIFGIGWGISGLCPGPGMLSLFTIPMGCVFLVCLAAGQLVGDKLVVPLLTPKPTDKESQPLANAEH